MKINKINLINTNIRQISFSNLVVKPQLKDTFELRNNPNISFGKKKSKEKVDKNQIYKQLRKAGCGEKETNSVLNNERKYKHLLSLMGQRNDLYKELSLKEMLSIASNEFDNEQTERYVSILADKLPTTRRLSQKEAVAIIKNNVPNNKIQRFIDLKDAYEDEGSLLSRPLTNSEACLVCAQDFNNIQAETYIRLKDIDLYFPLLEFIKDISNVERFITLTNTDEDGTTLLSRALSDKEAIQITISKFDNKEAQRVIDLMDNNLNNSRGLSYKEAESVVKAQLDDNHVQDFLNKKQYFQQLMQTQENKRPFIQMPSDDGIILTVKNNFDELKTSLFFELINMFYEKEATLIVCDDKKYSRLCSLVQEDTQQYKPLSLYEAGLTVKNNLTNEQVKIFKTLIDSETKSYEAINFVIDNDKVKKYNEYTSFEKPIFTRGLTSQEAYFSINKNFSEEQIQELINIKNINPDLDFDYIAILLDFIDYKNKTDITQLNSIEKRNLLKLLVKNNASLFNTTVSTSIYPLVPKNQEEYCTLLPALTNAIGINTKPISEEEKIQFFDTLNGLLKNICASNDLDIYLNSIYQVIPEIKAADIVEAIQVLKTMVINPKFLSLSQEDKNILTIATLLKDISENPLESSFDAFYIMQRFNLPEDMQLKIYELIKTSNWFEKLSKVKNGEVNKIAQDIAFETRHSNTFELSKILCEADLSLYSPEQRKEMKILADIIDSYLKKLQETQIFLPQTIIPKASQIKNGEVLSKDGISNVIFQINKTDKPLSSYGFQEGTTLENWQGLVHGLDTEQQLQIFTTFSLIDSEALLSSSYITSREYRGFRKQGLILDVNPNDIHAGYFKDFGSGFKKDIDTLKQHYLFPEKKQNTIWGGNRSQYRTYFPNLIKRKLDYSDSDYLRTIREIQDCKSITDVEEKNKKFAKTILEIFDNIHFGERKYNRQYNEILISRPKIQGVFSYGQKYEDIPLFLRKFAQDNDLPIIMFG